MLGFLIVIDVSSTRHNRFMPVSARAVRAVLCWMILIGLLLPALRAAAVEMLNDPNGYHGIRWGASLADAPDLTLAKTVERLSEFNLKNGAPTLDGVKVDFIHFIAIDQQFARVVIRYFGKATHEQLLAHFQKQYGPLDRTPGSMVRGLNQQFSWRGADTEVNITYESARDRGYVFIESRVLAPKFNEGLSETAY
jgi:hypothetical protein